MKRCERLHEATESRGIVVLATLSLVMASLLVGAGDTWAANLGDELLAAVRQNEVAVAQQVLADLKSPGHEDALAAAPAKLLALLNDPAFQGRSGQIDAWAMVMKDLAPAAGVAALTPWLAPSNPQMRLIAVSTMGLLGDPSGIDLLVAQLAGADTPADVRQTAALGMAMIGGERAGDALLQVYRSGDDATRQAVATAIASSGDAQLQQALKELS